MFADEPGYFSDRGAVLRPQHYHLFASVVVQRRPNSRHHIEHMKKCATLLTGSPYRKPTIGRRRRLVYQRRDYLGSIVRINTRPAINIVQIQHEQSSGRLFGSEDELNLADQFAPTIS